MGYVEMFYQSISIDTAGKANQMAKKRPQFDLSQMTEKRPYCDLKQLAVERLHFDLNQ